MIQSCQRFWSFSDFPVSIRGGASVPAALVIVLHLRRKRQHRQGTIARSHGEAAPEHDLVSLRGGDLIAAPNERIEHHHPGMRVVILRGGYIGLRMRQSAVRL